MIQPNKSQPKPPEPELKPAARESKTKKSATAPIPEVHIDQFPAFLSKIELLGNVTLQIQADELAARLQQKEEKHKTQPSHRMSVSDTVKHHLDDLEMMVYMLRLRLEEEAQKGMELYDFFARHRKKGQPFLQPLDFYQMVREVLPEATGLDRHIDGLYFLCKSSLFRGVSMARLTRILQLTREIDRLSLTIRLSIHPTRRPSVRLALLSSLQRNDLEGVKCLPYGTVKRLFSEQGITLTPELHELLAKRDLLFYQHSDEYIRYKELVDAAFQENIKFRQLVLGCFARVVVRAIRRKSQVVKKRAIKDKDKPSGGQTTKLLKSLKQTARMEDFVKKGAAKTRSTALQTGIARSILSEIIDAVPMLAADKVEQDLNVVKDVIISEKLSEHQHLDLFPRLFVSADYGRGLLLDKDMNLMQYDLPTGSQLPRVSLQTSLPCPRSWVLDVLVSSNNCVFVLMDNWHLWVWQLTGSSYRTCINVYNKGPSIDVNRYYKNDRFDNLFPKFLSESERYIVVNHSFCDSCLTLVDKTLLVVDRTVRMSKSQVGLTTELLQRAVQFYAFTQEAKARGKRVFSSSLITKEELSGLLMKEFASDMSILLDYLISGKSVLNEDMENSMDILLRKHQRLQFHMDEKVYRLVVMLRNHYESGKEKEPPIFKFDAEGVRRMLLTIDRRTTPNEAHEFWQYTTYHKIADFPQLKSHLSSLQPSHILSRRFSQSLLLIFQRCVHCGIPVREELVKLDHDRTSTVLRSDLRQLLLRLAIGLTAQEVEYLLESLDYTRQGRVDYEELLSHPQLVRAENSNLPAYRQEQVRSINSSLLPQICLEDVVLLEALQSLVYTNVYPRQPTILVSATCRVQYRKSDSAIPVAELRYHSNGPPLIKYVPSSGYLLSADKEEGAASDICLWELRWKEVVDIAEPLVMAPVKIIRNAHKNGVVALQYLPQTQTVMTSCLDGSVKVWDPIAQGHQNKRQKVRLAAGYYSYLSEEMAQTTFVEVKRMLFREVCYNLASVTLRYQLPENSLNQETQLCLMTFSVPKTTYQKSSTSLLCVYSMSRLKIEIKESKWQDQIPRKLSDMLQEMAKTRCRRMVNFRIASLPVIRMSSPLEELYIELLELNHINLPYRAFLDKVKELLQKRGRSKLAIGQQQQTTSSQDTASAIEQQLGGLVNCRQVLRKLLPDRSRQRKLVLLNIEASLSPRQLSLAEFSQCFSSAGVLFKQQQLEEVFNYFSHGTDRRVVDPRPIVEVLFTDRELLGWKRFLYGLAQAKSLLLYRNQLRQVQDVRSFLAAVKDADSLPQRRVALLQQYLPSSLDYAKVKILLERLPIEYQLVVPRFHREMAAELAKLHDSHLKKEHAAPSSKEFLSFLEVCSFEDQPHEHTIRQLAKELLPTQALAGMTVSKLASYLQSQKPDIRARLQRLCEHSEVEVQMPLFINYLCYNTDLNRGSLLSLAIEQPQSDFDCRDILGEQTFQQENSQGGYNLTISRIVTALKMLRKPVGMDKLCDGYREGPKIHSNSLQKWLQSIQGQLPSKQFQDFFYGYLKGDSLGYAPVHALQHALELGFARLSCQYDAVVWNSVFDYYGPEQAKDLKNSLGHIKQQLSNSGRKPVVVAGRDFLQAASRLYRAKKAQVFTRMGCIGSLADAEVAKSMLREVTYKVDDGSVHLEHLEQAVQLYKPKVSTEKPPLGLLAQQVLPRLPRTSLTIAVTDLPSYLAYSEKHLSLKEVHEYQAHASDTYGGQVPIEDLLPASSQLDAQCCRNIGYSMLSNGDSILELFGMADSDRSGFLREESCRRALQHVCSAFEAAVLTRLIDFNREQVTIEVFRDRLQLLIIRPALAELKKAFIYHLAEHSRLHFLQNFSQLDTNKAGTVAYEAVEKVVSNKGRRLYTVLLYNWISPKYVGIAEAKHMQLEYQPLVKQFDRDIASWMPEIQQYQQSLRGLLQRRLVELDISLYELYRINARQGELTLSLWKSILSSVEPSSSKFNWYFLERQASYLQLCQHLKAVTPELAPTNDSLEVFAELIHKKSSYYEVFRFLDQDKSGKISLAEFMAHCTNMRANLPSGTVKEIFLQLSHSQKEFSYDQFVECMQPLASPSDRNDWIFSYKRAVHNGVISVDEELLRNEDKLYAVLQSADCQRFLNVCHGMTTMQQVDALLQSIDTTDMLLKRLEAALLANNRKKDISDRKLFDKLVANYLSLLSLTKKECELLWEAYLNSRMKPNKANQQTRSAETVQIELNTTKIMEALKLPSAAESMERLGINRFSKLTKQNLKDLLDALGVVMSLKEVDSVLQHLNKATYRQLLTEAMPTSHVDLSDSSSAVLLNQIKLTVRLLCNRLNIGLKELFQQMAKRKGDSHICQKYWIPLLVFTLELKHEQARSLYYYLDDDRNGQVSQEQWLSKFSIKEENKEALSRSVILRMLDIHGNGYLRPHELSQLVEDNGLALHLGQGATELTNREAGLVNIEQWLSSLARNSPTEELALKRIPNEAKLIDRLIRNSTSVFALEEGIVAETISASTDGITLKSLVRAFRQAGIPLSEQDKSYFVSYFTVSFNHSFLDLKQIIEFVKRLSKRIVRDEDYGPFQELLKVIESKKLTPREMYRKIVGNSASRDIKKSQIVEYLRAVGLASFEELLPGILLQSNSSTEEQFLHKFDINLRKSQNEAALRMAIRIDKSPLGLYSIVSSVFIHLHEKYAGYDPFWQALSLKTEALTKNLLQRLLIVMGMWHFSEQQVDEFFQFLDDNRSGGVSYLEFATFWLGCEKAIPICSHRQPASKLRQIQQDTVRLFCEYVGERGARPTKEFSEADTGKKGYLTTSEFRLFLKGFGMRLADTHRLTELMGILDPAGPRGTVGYLPLMARLSAYCDVFSTSTRKLQGVRIYDRKLLALFQDLTLFEMRKYDGDYDSVLEVPELLRLVVSKLGRKSGSTANRLTQFLRDFVGLKCEDLLKFGNVYNRQLEDVPIDQIPPSANLSDALQLFRQYFSRSNRILQLSSHLHQSYRYLPIEVAVGMGLLTRLLQLDQLEAVFSSCQADIDDATKFLTGIAIAKYAEGMFRIPITDDAVTCHTVKNVSGQVRLPAKSLVFSSISRLNPFIQLATNKDTGHILLQPCKQAYGLLCLDSHTLDFHVKLSRDLYELPFCNSSITSHSQLIITHYHGRLFEDTVKKLGGLLFNPCFQTNFGEVAKGWASEILKLLKKTHETGLMGLLRPGNLTFTENGFGYRHMFMAIKCNQDGLARCGMDVLFGSCTESQFPQFNGDLSEPDVQAYLQKVGRSSFNAPQLRIAKQLSFLTPAIDVYALGALLFLMLFGQQPMSSEQGGIEPSRWSDRRLFEGPLRRVLKQTDLDQLWRQACSTDMGQAISNRIECSQQNKQDLRDLINVIQLCLNYDWFRRPSVDNLLSTVFGKTQKVYIEQLMAAEEYYSPELLLAPLQKELAKLVQVVVGRNENSSTALAMFGKKIDILKVMQMVMQSMDQPHLLSSTINQYYLEELLFVTLAYVGSQQEAAKKYPIEVVRSELIEVLESYTRVLAKLLTQTTSVAPSNYIEHTLRLFAKSYLRQSMSLLSDEHCGWIERYASDPPTYERLTSLKAECSFTWNELWWNFIADAYKSMLSNRVVRDHLKAAEEEQHIDQFKLQSKLQTLSKQQELRVSKSLVYYQDLVGISECLQSLHECAREQSSKSALKIVLGYVKSLVLSHDINKTWALLDSRIGEALRGFVAHRSPQIRQQVMALYCQLAMGLLPSRTAHRSAEEVHKSLGVLHHFMSTTDRMDRRKFQDFSNDYYGFRADIVKQILRQVCRCFSLSVLSSALSQWNTDTLDLFSNLLHGGDEMLLLLNSPTVEAFQNFYVHWSKAKDEPTQAKCRQLHSIILAVNSSKLFDLLKGNSTITRIVQKLEVEPFQEMTLFFLSNRYVLLMNHYNKHAASMVAELEGLALSRHQTKQAKPAAKLARLEQFRKQLTLYLDQVVRFVRRCPRDRMLPCSQLIDRLSVLLRRLVDELGTFQQLSMNAELIVVRCLVFYEQLLQEHWVFLFNAELLKYLLEQLFCAYSYHGRIRESQTQLSIQNLQQVQPLQSPQAIIEYVLRHDLLRKFMQNRMCSAANSLMRSFVAALTGELQSRLYGIGFVGSFCKLARWQYSLVLAYMQTKTQNLHVLQSYVEEANFRVRIFDLLVKQKSSRLQNELIKAGFMEFVVKVLLPNEQQFDMRFYRSSEQFLPYRYSIPLRNQALCMITAVFWSKPRHIMQQLVAQMLKHGTIRHEANILTTLKPNDMRLLDSLWLSSQILTSNEPNLLLEADNYGVRTLVDRLLETNPELRKFYPALNATVQR